MNSSVIIFPGSNCDKDIALALEKFNFKNSMVWHNESNLPKSDIVVLPGGFAYGDYLRTGAIAAKSKILKEVVNHAQKGGLVLGICNGFQILTETGLLEGTLIRNKNLKFLCKNVFLKVISESNKFCSNYNKKIIELHIAHNEGSFHGSNELLKKLKDKDLIAFKYSDKIGNISDETNPNGSLDNIAGIFNDKKNILGMMPHPERMISKNLSGIDGNLMFECIKKNLS